MVSSSVKVIFGGAPIGPGVAGSFVDEESIEHAYKLLEEGGCDTIDTARIYGDSEVWMGKTGAGKRFTIDSKTPGGFGPGTSTGEGILQHAKEAVERLQVKSVSQCCSYAIPDSDNRCRSTCTTSTRQTPR
jgi:aryl-alcohol dehydrogenase-like predicted oxidoreductase